MAVKQKNYVSSRSEYTAFYRDMRGVDLSGDGFGISPGRFAYLENMYKDYGGLGSAVTESIPGFRKILGTEEPINGIFARYGKKREIHIVIHAGEHLYSRPLSELDNVLISTPIFTLANRKSHARAFGGALYLFDGDGIVLIDDEGAVRVSDDGRAAPYVPTTFVNGKEYEQRNLLTKKFAEKTFIGSCSDYGHGTRGLGYEILSETEGTAVLSSAGNVSGEIHVPSTVRINGRPFTVTEIADRAFRENSDITSVSISEGIRIIGRQAFYKCPELTEVRTPDSLELIKASAFEGCEKLSDFHLGGGVQELGAKCFDGCTALKHMQYSMNAQIFSEITNFAAAESITVVFDTQNLKRTVELPIYTPTKELTRVTLDGLYAEHQTVVENGYIKAIVLKTDNKYLLEGREIAIEGTVCDAMPTKSNATPDVLLQLGDADPASLIFGCTVSESFDGRIFVGGNPTLPNTVFYTARDKSGANNPLYFGSLNYFSDGIGGHTTVALLAASNMLAVFKSGDDGCGSIFYHSPMETGFDILPKVYPVSYVHSGVYATGGAISFFDDPLFVSPLGICALEKQAINLDRGVSCRSHNVNSLLLTENPEKIRLAEWCGYLAVLTDGRIYLADSRATFAHSTGAYEYEWYLLSGIGTYKNDKRVYRYSSVAPEGYEVHEHPGGIAEGEIYSEGGEYGNVYFVKNGDKKYAVSPTEEFRGGEFSPACELLGIHEYLIFGTESGDVCVFNNDLRGVPPTWLSESEDYDAEEYARAMGRRIHTDFYSFAGHAPRYALKTALDNCGIPHLTKNTVKDSLTLKCRAFTNSKLVCEVGTDRSGYRETASFPTGTLDFSVMDFTALSTVTESSFTVPIKEREKGWIEKQITLYSDEFASPFGIYSLSYRFTVKGKIKKQ